MSHLLRATAYSPGSIGNLGPGLDVLGCALDIGGDSVSAEWTAEPGLVIADAGHPDLPLAAEQHASGIAALGVLGRAASLGAGTGGRGIALRVVKGLPLAAGQGGSAASAVAGAAAVNALLGSPLSTLDLMASALEAEATVAGRHLDNIAPALLGGIVLVRSLDPVDVISLPVPAELRVVVAQPSQQLRTAEARRALPGEVPRATALHQGAQIGAIVAACFTGDLQLLGRSIDDRIAEPARARLLPGFPEAKRAAAQAGALGVSISGAGPSVFALCDDEAVAARVSRAMRDAYGALGIACVATPTRIDRLGTRLQRSGTPVQATSA
jgi:homoserine kinase